MKMPRSVSGTGLIKALKRLGYEQSILTGSHIRLSLQQLKQHLLTIPNHDSNSVGTLAAILADISAQLDIPRDELIRKLFG